MVDVNSSVNFDPDDGIDGIPMTYPDGSPAFFSAHHSQGTHQRQLGGQLLQEIPKKIWGGSINGGMQI